jgi:hypothetical protein
MDTVARKAPSEPMQASEMRTTDASCQGTQYKAMFSAAVEQSAMHSSSNVRQMLRKRRTDNQVMARMVNPTPSKRPDAVSNDPDR